MQLRSAKPLMFMLALVWFLSYADRVNISVAALAMQDQFNWSETTKGIVLGSVFLGYISSQLIGGWLTDRVSRVRLIAFSTMGFSAATMLTPYAAELSLPALLTMRVLLGVFEGFIVPATYSFVGGWSATDNKASMLAIVVSGATLGAPGGLALSGVLVSLYEWPMVFYLFGALGFLWSFVWLAIAADLPPGAVKPKAMRATTPAVPVARILRESAVWALVFNKFCATWMVYVFLAWLPSYFSAAQGVSISTSGFFSALPWVAMSAMLYVAAGFSDHMLRAGQNIDFVRKLMQSLGLGGAMLFLALVPLTDSPGMALAVTCCAMAALACCYSGADPTIMEIAPRYRGFITGLVGTIGNLPGIIAIPLIGWLIDQTGSYNWGFITAALLNVLGLVVWLRYGTGRKVID